MKRTLYLPRFNYKEKLKVYTGGPVNKGFYERNLKKAKSTYMIDCFNSPTSFYRKKRYKKFNQVIDNYYDKYIKTKIKYKLLSKSLNKKKENKFDYKKKFQIKKKDLNALFTYNLKDNEILDFSITEELIKSMFNGEDDKTMIKTPEIKDDYEMRLYGKKKKKIILKIENQESTKDEIKNDTSKIEEDDDNETFTFIDGGEITIDDNYLKLKNNSDRDPSLFEDIINKDFYLDYNPPIYNLPQSLLGEEEKKNENEDSEYKDFDFIDEKEEEKIQKEEEIYKQNKKTSNKDLKMLNNIVQDDEFPQFDQLINPYFQTNYIPPEVFPKPKDLEEEYDEDNFGYDDFELDKGKDILGNGDNNNLFLINRIIQNNESKDDKKTNEGDEEVNYYNQDEFI